MIYEGLAYRIMRPIFDARARVSARHWLARFRKAARPHCLSPEAIRAEWEHHCIVAKAPRYLTQRQFNEELSRLGLLRGGRFFAKEV